MKTFCPHAVADVCEQWNPGHRGEEVDVNPRNARYRGMGKRGHRWSAYVGGRGDAAAGESAADSCPISEGEARRRINLLEDRFGKELTSRNTEIRASHSLKQSGASQILMCRISKQEEQQNS
jgi:hypothetical protein